MAITWTYDPAQDVVVESCLGETERADVLGLVRKQRTTFEPTPSTRYLCDYRTCSAPMTPVDLRVFGRDRAHSRDGRPVGPHAIVVDTDVRYGMARMLQAYFEFYSAPHDNVMRVFRCIDEARQWLGLPAGQVAAS
ncbi:MAG: hypothetical protein QNJ98_19220 [Planctomycetota bacterium]|nr:hypothetical protein [Planctomycetota bacterium]